MKYIVKVEGRKFEVELGDLFTQPVIARVDGEPIEVWLEDGNGSQPAGQIVSSPTPNEPKKESQSPNKHNPQMKEAGKTPGAGKSKSIHSPIPGVIISIAVQPGSHVSIGQEVCVLEAMKMKNIIRAPRDGKLASVHVTNGQIVKHHDLLVEYAED